ncbi:MAG: helix-turn-helix domain-containing protein [Candidatus Pseudobacter hemicellulosilyticus]|uniref:Helix-turn-helix domain-containing protein n=1 Tax=Candidatus Pseudobacter hemicellulosilyticus TaxID=3121375 RepID=A0AAJ5WSX8_9BACT|nr:MAG: helix-turn-helix domain-containing protein [Pseudobacter sp.]
MKKVLDKPTKADQQFAKETISELEKRAKPKKSTSHVYISFQTKGNEESLEVPEYVIHYLRLLLDNMAAGKAVQVSPIETELSTQEAADMLGVSRPFLVKLLEQGKIPFKKIGTHRRIDLKDLQIYERKQKAIRDKQLQFLARQGQDLQLGYDL